MDYLGTDESVKRDDSKESYEEYFISLVVELRPFVRMGQDNDLTRQWKSD